MYIYMYIYVTAISKGDNENHINSTLLKNQLLSHPVCSGGVWYMHIHACD